MSWLDKLLDSVAGSIFWFLTGRLPSPAVPSAPTFTLSNGAPIMGKPYDVTVNPPAAKDANAVKVTFTYTLTAAGGSPSEPVAVDATSASPVVPLGVGETLAGSYTTTDGAGVVTPAGPVGSVTGPVEPSAPTFTLANAPA